MRCSAWVTTLEINGTHIYLERHLPRRTVQRRMPPTDVGPHGLRRGDQALGTGISFAVPRT